MIEAPTGSTPQMIELVRRINAEFLNRSKLPAKMPVYTVATLPSAADFKDCWVDVSNETGGYVAAFSNGTNWLRCTDRAIVS